MNSVIRYVAVASVIVSFSLFTAVDLSAGVLLPAFFSDDMVLQRGVELKIFGEGVADEQVTVQFNGQERTVWPDEKTGKWLVKLMPMTATTYPRDMTIKTKSGTFTIKNVLVGDVWFCGGEEGAWSSLGRLPSSWAIKFKGEKSQVRVFDMKPQVLETPQTPMFLSGRWRTTAAKDASKISGVAYLFAKALHDKLKVPIGVINARSAGSSIQSWIPMDVYKTDRMGKMLFARWRLKELQYTQKIGRWKKALDKWEKSKTAAETNNRRFTRLPPKKPLGAPTSPLKPAGLHNSVIAPLKGLRLRGVVWSQGAGDTQRSKEYSTALSLFVKSSRVFWNDASLPIIFELPSESGSKQRRPIESRQAIATIRNKQLICAEKNPGVSVVPSFDLGWANKLPRFDLARRLASTAFAAIGEKGEPGAPMVENVTGDGSEVRITFLNVGSGLMGREKYKFTGDYSSLIGKTIRIIRKGKKKRLTLLESKKGERRIVRADVDLRDKKGKVIKHIKTVWDKTYVDPVRNFLKAETTLTQDEKKLWSKRRAKLAEERKKKAEEKRKSDELRKKHMEENGGAPKPPPTPKKPKPVKPALPVKTVKPPPPKGTVKTTLYMLNSKKLIGFTVSGEKTPLSWATARIDGDSVVVTRKGDDPIIRVRYGYADNPLASLCDKNGIPALPFDEKVKQNVTVHH